jgi:hypothetical protein
MSEWRAEECAFEPSSLVDPVGRVFHRDGRVFRAIAAPHGAFMLELVRQARVSGWFDLGLVPSWSAAQSVAGFEAVIEHQRIPFVTLRGEWSGEGLRAAGACILRLQAALLRHGLCLKDAHPWNVLFDGARPLFIDWGSIRPAAELHWDFWYAQFRQFILAPLYMFSRGRARMARAMLREHSVGVGNELLALPGLRRLPKQGAAIAASAAQTSPAQAVDRLADYLARIELPPVAGEWQAYPQPRFEGLADLPGLRLKDRIVAEALAADPAATVFDLGTNQGLHADIAATLGKRVIACDIEEDCLNRLYLRSAQSGRDVLPLYHDFLWPIGESGFMNMIPSSAERLRCDTVLAMAVSHHLVLRNDVSFDAFALGLRRLCRQRAVVEFVPAGDVHVAAWRERFPPWYTLDHFAAAMSRHFSRVTMVASEPAPRVVLLCEVKA